MTPSVHAMSVKEWPAPATLTVRPIFAAAPTIFRLPPSLLGFSTDFGPQVWVRRRRRGEAPPRARRRLRRCELAQLVDRAPRDTDADARHAEREETDEGEGVERSGLTRLPKDARPFVRDEDLVDENVLRSRPA